MPTIPRYTSPFKTTRRIVVVGGVAAGPAAAARAARQDPDAEVVLFEQGADVSYGVCELPYLIDGEIGHPDDLVVFTPDELAAKKRVTVRALHRALRIHPAQRRLEVTDLASGGTRTESYDRLVLATGARARTLPQFPSGLANVHALKSLDDARGLMAFFAASEPRRAAITGAGYIGIEAAETLAARGLEVTLVAPETEPMPYADPEARALIADMLRAAGIRFLGGRSIAAVKTDGPRAVSLRTNEETVEADLFITAAGLIPNTELAHEARIRTGRDGGILVDARQSTNVDGIFAAGDCAEVLNVVTGRTQLMPFASLANRTGRTAGTNAAGGSAAFRGSVPLSALRVFGHEIAQAGLTRADASAHGFDIVHVAIVAHTRVPVMPGAESIMVTLTAERRSGRLLGGALVAPEHAAQRANMLALAIRQRLTVDQFLDSDFVYTPRLAPVWDPLLVCAQRLQRSIV